MADKKEDKKEEKEAPKDDKKESGAEGEGSEGDGSLNEEEAALAAKKKKKKMILLAAVAGLLVIGGGAGLFFSGVLGGSKAPPAEGTTDAQESAEDKEKEKNKESETAKPAYYSLGDILVNLASDPKRPSFLKITINLELADEKDKAALDALKPRILDDFQVYLRELRVEDLRGSAGLYRLREELLLRVSETVKPIRIRDVLFQELLVQ